MTDTAPRCWGCGCKLEVDEPQPAFCVRCWLVPGWPQRLPERQAGSVAAMTDAPDGWPTMPETTETCPRCGKPLTGAWITSRWSARRFTVACPCSPRQWIEMEIPSST